MKSIHTITLSLGLIAAIFVGNAAAGQGTIPKWSQLPFDMRGENIPSTIDWRDVGPQPAFEGVLPNWNVADDFRSDGRPILSVRWWGSYFDPAYSPSPTSGFIEDTFVISFFSDVPAEPGGFSTPGTLLGTYVAPITRVKVDPTPLTGWDQHRVWQYEVNLMDTHLEHASELATQDSFNEKAGDIYWLSVTASNGHQLIIDGDEWSFRDTFEPPLDEHWWGWHTSPEQFNDMATVTSVRMDDSGQWLYGQWTPIDPVHEDFDMAFELLTIPIPSVVWLFTSMLAGLGVFGRRGRR